MDSGIKIMLLLFVGYVVLKVWYVGLFYHVLGIDDYLIEQNILIMWQKLEVETIFFIIFRSTGTNWVGKHNYFILYSCLMKCFKFLSCCISFLSCSSFFP